MHIQIPLYIFKGARFLFHGPDHPVAGELLTPAVPCSYFHPGTFLIVISYITAPLPTGGS